MKPHIKTLPCFPQVAAVIGESRAQIELCRVIYSKCGFDKNQTKLIHAFSWWDSPQLAPFWVAINQGINPYHD